MHFASTLLQTALHWLSPQGHAVIQRLVVKEGYSGSATELAMALGLRNRFQLSRMLDREGLPCLEDLSGWIRVTIWVLQWEASRRAVSRTALEAIRDPAPCYRTVRRYQASLRLGGARHLSPAAFHEREKDIRGTEGTDLGPFQPGNPMAAVRR